MSVQLFLMLLLITSILVSLTVEALKNMLTVNFSPNIMAAIVSIIISIVVGIFYCILAEVVINSQIIVYLIALTFLSWLCAMLGYDKVIQALKQIKGGI